MQGHPKTWYPIGVGGAGCSIIDEFFSSLKTNHINISAMSKPFRNQPGLPIPKTLTEHILTKGVAGELGWWVLNTSGPDLHKMKIFGKKLTYHLLEEKQLPVQQNSFFNSHLLKSITENQRCDFAKQTFLEGEEGAGKCFILGEQKIVDLIDEESGEPKIKKILDVKEKGRWRNTNAVLMVHALSRGTGSGGTGVLIDKLKQIRPNPKPISVVTITVLPDYHKINTHYDNAVLSALFGLISILQTKNGKRNADNVILVHNVKLNELIRRPRPAFIYADKSPFFGTRFFRKVDAKKPSTRAYNGMIVDLMGLMCSGNLLTEEERVFDVNNLIEQTNNLKNRIEPDIPAILVPAVYISPNKKSSPSELIKTALKPKEDWLYVHCIPETAKAIFPLLFFDQSRLNLSPYDIEDQVHETVMGLYPKSKMTIISPDYVNTCGAFSACALFLVDPKIPVLETYASIADEIFTRADEYKSLTSDGTTLIDQTREKWYEKYKKRTQLMIDIINHERG